MNRYDVTIRRNTELRSIDVYRDTIEAMSWLQALEIAKCNIDYIAGDFIKIRQLKPKKSKKLVYPVIPPPGPNPNNPAPGMGKDDKAIGERS